MKNIFKNQSGVPSEASAELGQVSRVIIFIAIACFLVIVVVYGVTTFISYQRAHKKTTATPTPEEPAGPLYDTTVGPIRFLFESAEDLGTTLKAQHSYNENLSTTERFIKLTIGAQNLGKINTSAYAWDVGDIVDSTGRHFVNINDKAYDWVPRPDLCGTILKPQFSPTPCVKYYEVSRVSTSLKVQVKVSDPIKGQSMLDIIVK